MKKLKPQAVPPKKGRKKKRVVRKRIPFYRQKPVDAPELPETKVADSLPPV